MSKKDNNDEERKYIPQRDRRMSSLMRFYEVNQKRKVAASRAPAAPGNMRERIQEQSDEDSQEPGTSRDARQGDKVPPPPVPQADMSTDEAGPSRSVRENYPRPADRGSVRSRKTSQVETKPRGEVREPSRHASHTSRTTKQSNIEADISPADYFADSDVLTIKKPSLQKQMSSQRMEGFESRKQSMQRDAEPTRNKDELQTIRRMSGQKSIREPEATGTLNQGSEDFQPRKPSIQTPLLKPTQISSSSHGQKLFQALNASLTRNSDDSPIQAAEQVDDDVPLLYPGSRRGSLLHHSIHHFNKSKEASLASILTHNSVLLPGLEDTEKEFHNLVALGDVDKVKEFLRENSGFNINCVSYQKISALHVAVQANDEAMVDFLLSQKHLDLSDCVFHSIRSADLKILEMLLDRIQETAPALEFSPCSNSVEFSDDLTPLILAAQLGQYETIDFLLKRGHVIPDVHPPDCDCIACRTEHMVYDRLKYSTMKLNLYKAVCSPEYLFHSTSDPIQRAFELVKHLQMAAKLFPQFQGAYTELWTELRNFTVDLIGCCRNAGEVNIILKQPGGCHAATNVKFPRLQMAVDLKQKQFVAHPFTQAVLEDEWSGDMLEWKTRSPLMQSLTVLPRIVMLPVITFMCVFLPNHSAVKRWSLPVNKLLSSSASYLLFLVFIFMQSNLDKKNQLRGPPESGLEPIIIVYVFGFIWSSVHMCVQQGGRRYLQVMWNLYDVVMEVFFVLTFCFWLAAKADVAANGQQDLPRKYWNSLDPTLIAEGFFALGTIMAFFRLNLLLYLNYYVGPLQVSIGKMTVDILKFILVFGVMILSWSAGLSHFYQPYDGMVQKDAATGSSTSQVSSFVSFGYSLKTFFWAVFGVTPIESADVVIEDLEGETPGQTITNEHRFTEIIGYVAFAGFQFLATIVVLNMLVACMANTFTKVIDNVPVEWVFGRTQIYLSFISQTTLPPPWNLVPTASGIKSVLTWLKLFLRPDKKGPKARFNFVHCCYLEDSHGTYLDQHFAPLMSELAQRYLRHKEEISKEDTNHELDDIKKDITDVKDILRRLDKDVHPE